MVALNREQFNVLVLIRDETLSHKIYIRPSAICKSFSPPLELKVVEASLENLVEEQFAETDGRGRYRVTHLGSEMARITIEGQLGKNPKFDHMMLTRSPWKFEEAAYRKKFTSIDWTKWGTIVGIVGVVVTILIAVVF